METTQKAVQTATKNFESKGFHLLEHQKYSSRINNKEEIQKLEDQLSSTTSPKEKTFLNSQLKEQTQEQKEILTFYKDYIKESKGLFKNENETLSIQGLFMPSNSIYKFSFHAKNHSYNTTPRHKLSTAGKLEMKISKNNLKKSIIDYVNSEKQELEIPKTIEIASGNSKGTQKVIIKPPYLIKTENQDFEKAYSDIIKTINKLGYPLK